MSTKQYASTICKQAGNLVRSKRIRNGALAIVVAGFIAVLLINMSGGSHAASGSGTLSLTPASGTYTVGSDVTLTVQEDSGSTGINAAEVDINFSQTALQYVSYSVAGSGFNYPGPSPSVSGGSFKYAIFDTGSLAGNQNVLTITFKVLSSGNTTVSFASSAAVIEPSGTNENATPSSAVITLTAPTTPPPPTNPPPTTTTTHNTPSPTSAPTKSSESSGTNVTPSGSSTPVNVPSGASLKVTAPASVSPTTTSSATPANPIVKVNYYLNQKLLASITHPPYSYKLDTTKILNGTYTFTTKTYYLLGGTHTTNQNLIIANPLSLTQVRLATQHYALPGGAIVLIVIVALVLIYGRRRVAYYIRHKLLPPPPAESPVVVVQSSHPPESTPTPIPTQTTPNWTPPSSQSPSPGAVYSPHPHKDDDKGN